MSVASIVAGRGPVIRVSADSPVRAIVALLHVHRIGAVLVMDGEEIRGIVSERDIAAGLHTLGAAILDTAAVEIMTAPVLTVAPQATVAEAMSVMTNRRIRHLPVVENEQLLGLVSIGDLVKQRIEDAEQEALLLKDYIATA
jgi:CBS domain-containing protein